MRLSGIAETGGRRILAVWLGVAACCPQAGAVELLRIHGTTYRALCNPLTGDVYTDSVRRSAFTLVMAGHQWRISAEDLADSDYSISERLSTYRPPPRRNFPRQLRPPS